MYKTNAMLLFCSTEFCTSLSVCEWTEVVCVAAFFVHRLLKRPIGHCSQALRFYPPVFQSMTEVLFGPFGSVLRGQSGFLGCLVYKCSSVVCIQTTCITTLPLSLSPRCEMLPSVQKVSLRVDSVGWCFETDTRALWFCMSVVLLSCCCWKRMNDLFFYCSKQSIWTVCVGALSRLLPCIFFIC